MPGPSSFSKWYASRMLIATSVPPRAESIVLKRVRSDLLTVTILLLLLWSGGGKFGKTGQAASYRTGSACQPSLRLAQATSPK